MSAAAFIGGVAASSRCRRITGFYMTRMVAMTFFGKKRWEADAHPHESPAVMTIPLVVLALGSAFLGMALLFWGDIEELARAGRRLRESVPTPLPDVRLHRRITLDRRHHRRHHRLGHRTPGEMFPWTRRRAIALTRAARQDLYGDAVNHALVVRPAYRITRREHWSPPLTARAVDGFVNWFRCNLRRWTWLVACGAPRVRLRALLRIVHGGGRPHWSLLALVLVSALMNCDLPLDSYPWLTTIASAATRSAASCSPFCRRSPMPTLAKHGLRWLVSGAVLALTIAMALQFDGASKQPFQFVESYPWIPSFGISYSVGVDGIGLVLVALAATLVPIVILAGWRDIEGDQESEGSVKGYFALVLALEALMIGVFAATDVFLFYVFFEAMLIPVYFMIGRYGGPQSAPTPPIKFLLYSLLGGLFMLASLIGLYVVSARESRAPALSTSCPWWAWRWTPTRRRCSSSASSSRSRSRLPCGRSTRGFRTQQRSPNPARRCC